MSRHVYGTRFGSPPDTTLLGSPYNVSSPDGGSKANAARPSDSDHGVSSTNNSTDGTLTPLSHPQSLTSGQAVEEPVLARISYHAVREERAFYIARNLVAHGGGNADHIVRPLDFIRLAPVPGDRGPVIVSIYQHPGHNYLFDVLDMGPAFYKVRNKADSWLSVHKSSFKLDPPISLESFLDFAVGAAQCLELLHHGQGMIHGEVRGDAFHFNLKENKVRIMSFGSGVRSFEHGLTSTGWSALSKELGAKNKLLYISPEQTGRLPAEPDSRTDLYSLGVLLWSLLTQRPVFDGETPLDIVQGVLGRRIPIVSSVRIDVPDVIGRIIQKCTAKNIADRYVSASGLRYDLLEVQKLLGDGNWDQLKDWRIGTKDVSSFFLLPTSMIGRQREKDELVKVIDRVAKSHSVQQKVATSRSSDGSALSTDLMVFDDLSSEGASSADGTNRRSGSFSNLNTDPKQTKLSSHPLALSDTQTTSHETASSTLSGPLNRLTRTWDRHQSVSMETKSIADSLSAEGNRLSASDSISPSLSKQLGSAQFRRRGHCEVVIVEGAGGLGKSLLVETVLGEARRRGYCATAKFDTSRRTAFGPLLKLLSALFRQVWGERNTETPFHLSLRQFIRPVWPMLHRVLGLPEFLLEPPEVSGTRSTMSSQIPPNRDVGSGRIRLRDRGSSPGGSIGSRNSGVNSQNSQEFLRGGSSAKSLRLMNTFLDVLRVFTSHKFVCFYLDDLHFADDESLELVSQILSSRLKMVVIMTYRSEEMSAEKLQSVLQPADSEGR